MFPTPRTTTATNLRDRKTERQTIEKERRRKNGKKKNFNHTRCELLEEKSIHGKPNEIKQIPSEYFIQMMVLILANKHVNSNNTFIVLA